MIRRATRILLFSLLLVAILVPLLGSSVASAATGEVSWTNPPENKGRISSDDDGTTYQYNVNAGNTAEGWEPALGQRVTFIVGPGNAASDVIPENPAG